MLGRIKAGPRQRIGQLFFRSRPSTIEQKSQIHLGHLELLLASQNLMMLSRMGVVVMSSTPSHCLVTALHLLLVVFTFMKPLSPASSAIRLSICTSAVNIFNEKERETTLSLPTESCPLQRV